METTTDANNNQLTYTYDKLGRKTGEYNTTSNPIATAPELAAWTYDPTIGTTTVKGQANASIRYTNGASDATHTYTEQVTGYTALYQPTGESVTIPSAEGNLAGTYSVTQQYTTETSLLSGTHYNAEGGLPREQVNFGYDLAGTLTGFGGTYGYLDNVTYTPWGQVTSTNFGPSGSQLQQTEAYDLPTGRLLTVTDGLQTMTNTLQATTYTYNQAGTITSASTSQYGVSAPDTQCYIYDQLSRLKQAFTSTDAVNDPTTGQIQGIGACADTAPVAGKVTGGPAPYWQIYTYDALGDRVKMVNHDTSVTSAAKNVTQTLTYPSYNAATSTTSAAPTPDALTSTSTTGPTGTTASSYSYYADGSTKTRSGQSFTYDAEGHIQAVKNTTTSVSSTYTYDADGKLLIQHDPASNQVIAYLPYGEQLTLNTGSGAVTGQRYYTASPDGVSCVRESNGTVYYELADKLGTNTTQINQSTLAYQFRYLDPYGNQIAGTAQTSWGDQHAYLNQPQDPATSLDLLGARQYDPVTGRFLSVDPILETGDQRQMNGYSYTADNPVNGSDPTGLQADQPCRSDTSSGATVSAHGECGGGGGTPETLQQLCANSGGTYANGNCTWPNDEGNGDNSGGGGGGCSVNPLSWGKCAADVGDSIRTDWDAQNRFISQHLTAFIVGTIVVIGGVACVVVSGGACLAVIAAGFAEGGLFGAGAACMTSGICEATGTAAFCAAMVCDGAFSDGPQVGCGQSFSADTQILTADGHKIPIASAETGQKIKAVNTATGKTDTQTIDAVMVKIDTDLYDLTVVAPHGKTTIHTTSDHLFWDETTHRWVKASSLHAGDRLFTADNTIVTAAGGTATHNPTGWMWDLTVSNDHNFYVVTSGGAAILVHNCDPVTAFGVPSTPGVYTVHLSSGEKYVGMSTRDIASRVNAAATSSGHAVAKAGYVCADICNVTWTDLPVGVTSVTARRVEQTTMEGWKAQGVSLVNIRDPEIDVSGLGGPDNWN